MTTEERISFAVRRLGEAIEALGAVRPNLSVAGAPPELLRDVDEASEKLDVVAARVRWFQEGRGQK